MYFPHIQKTIVALEHELEVLDQQRGDLTRAIDTLRPFADPDGKRKSGTRALSKRTNERTNERTKQGPRQRAARSLPEKTQAKGAAILAMLKQHREPMSPGALAKALKLKSTATLNYQLQPLVRAKQVVVTGVTAGRRISLPGAHAAKEAP